MPAGQVTGDGRAIELADGDELPMLGLGVWQVRDGAAAVNAVRWALELGYRHIDTAQAYGNEASVGRALHDSGVDRGEVFVTTKFHPGRKDPVAELEQSLRRLRLDHVDLYLVHWVQRNPVWPWPGMERARERGLTASIGVSNYGQADLDQVIAAGTTPPVVNQVQFSSLGTGRHLANPVVTEVAARAGRTPAQVLLRWCLQHGVPVIPKSAHRDRIEENAQIFDFVLPEKDMAALDALDTTGGTARAV
jgi:diketogulonate reductase-like aldo/keto reductase